MAEGSNFSPPDELREKTTECEVADAKKQLDLEKVLIYLQSLNGHYHLNHLNELSEAEESGYKKSELLLPKASEPSEIRKEENTQEDQNKQTIEDIADQTGFRDTKTDKVDIISESKTSDNTPGKNPYCMAAYDKKKEPTHVVPRPDEQLHIHVDNFTRELSVTIAGHKYPIDTYIPMSGETERVPANYDYFGSYTVGLLDKSMASSFTHSGRSASEEETYPHDINWGYSVDNLSKYQALTNGNIKPYTEMRIPRPRSLSETATQDDHKFIPQVKQEDISILDISHSYRNHQVDSDQSSVSTDATTDSNLDKQFTDQCDPFPEPELMNYYQDQPVINLPSSFTRLLVDSGPSGYYSGVTDSLSMSSSNSVPSSSVPQQCHQQCQQRSPLQSQQTSLCSSNLYQPPVYGNENDLHLLTRPTVSSHAMLMYNTSLVSMHSGSSTMVSSPTLPFPAAQPPLYDETLAADGADDGVDDFEEHITSTMPTHGSKAKRFLKPGCRLWEFIRNLLFDPTKNPSIICWEDRKEGVFRLVNSKEIACIWGRKKGNQNMSYEKLSRAMRYYYKRKVFEPVLGKRLLYKFGPKATGWREHE